ncbi:nucleoid-associated protein [Streptomyces sp. SBT349]|uniref:nucleoid-associated protein n=1 Tax=Streptomyces sp. SBT349 TaxID=1580539 RepID=UPI00066E4874|nr:nucleoid-associated protein [Streptomyces sp. SBT349]
MRSDFGNLIVDEAIVHSIPKKTKTDLVPVRVQFSEAVCGLNSTVRSELEAKFSEVLISLGREVVVDAELKSALPDQVRAFLEGERHLVEASKEIAELLLASQPINSSDGLLLVALVRLDGSKSLLMVKLEQESGMQATEIVTDDGLRTFDVQYFANLMFTEASRVYKIALFSASGMSEDAMEGWAADKQMTGKNLAKFFREKFLGCQLKSEPRQLTLRFHDAALDWINSRVSDADTRITYLMAVLVELQSPTPVLDPDSFIRTRLQQPHRESFAEYLRDSDVPEQVFDKDTDLVEPKLRKMRMAFDNGAVLIAPLEALHGDSIKIVDLDDGRARLTVTGVMTETRSHGQGKGRPHSGQQDDTPAVSEPDGRGDAADRP